ncbi:unnamed protein product [Tilletia controversa]|uniref:PHP domain-like protein n=3 Tax=Tilletia TaxID=13289 RepID=A0A8X7MS01_9BASI|nr:hypothetical protein CF335_g8139 [Tilletia laevis]KAE8196872.1 hypothetical protein CF328_g4011 [Tilletia controversa]KAE8251206.1 hypothetical protein A4X03_0g6399 [Tilletia caries]KAE8200049.1 hypothetical protein CF336_g910 [Tilletia laevis]KAE8247062.1 hypothetical protein A4X06_0g4727 [Tilletia controversa]
MLDLNIPWPTQTFADAHRAGVALRQQQQQQQAVGGTSSDRSGGDAQVQDGDQAPLSKKAKKKMQKQQQYQQQQQQQQQPSPSLPLPSDPTASSSSSSNNKLPEWSPLDELPNHDQLRLRLLTTSLASLGYKSCAFNYTLVQATRFDPSRHGNPFSAHSAAASAAGFGGGKGKGAGGAPGGKRAIAPVPFPELDPRFRGSSGGGKEGKGKGKQKAITATTNHLSLDVSFLDPGSQPIHSLRIVQLHRLTLPLDDSSCSSAPGQGHGLVAGSASALQSYDLLAVSPTTEAAFSLACLTLAELRPFGIDIISLDLGSQPRLPFWVKRSLVKAAIQLGIVFEVAYSGALASVSSGSGSGSGSGGGPSADVVRRNLISSTRSLLLLTKGTNVIISSGARDAMQLRAPLDVINLFGAILGMGEGAARQAIGAGPEAVVRRARARKEVWRGIVGEVRLRTTPGSQKAPDGSLGLEAAATVGDSTMASQDQAGLDAGGTSKESGAQRSKRKREDGEAG